MAAGAVPDWLDEVLDPKPKANLATVELKPVNHELAIRQIEDDLLKRSMAVVDATLRFGELDPKAEGPPDEWVEKLGQPAAIEAHRVAQAAWLPTKDAPIGITVATKVMSGIIKARAAEKAGPRSLNVAFVQMTAPAPIFPELEVDGEPDKR